ncbi:hypothetical protein DRQ25_00230 [Candidatus Fermentibacteria bacterium]|nr:MAG: hypothetical protein DRQ25_00230 [Candidatus Fermentibacteria bacterium]
MNFGGHLAGGFLTAVVVTAVLYFFGLFENLHWLWGIPLCVLYSLIPDLDHPNSRIRKYFEIFALCCILLSSYAMSQNYVLLWQGALVSMFFAGMLLFVWTQRHRGTFHTLFFGYIISLPLMLFEGVYVVYALLGFITHLILDKKVRVI